MSLLPRDLPIARIGRAGQRMAPGGRRWSESPIPRVATRRVPRVGPVDVPAPATVGWVQFDVPSPKDGTNKNSPALQSASVWDGDSYVSQATGDHILALVISDGALTIPSGWDEVDSGDVGSLKWLVLHILRPDYSGDYVATANAGDAAMGHVWVYRGVGPGWSPVVTVVDSGTADASIAIPTVEAGMSGQVSAAAWLEGSGGSTLTWTPSNPVTTYGVDVVLNAFGMDYAGVESAHMALQFNPGDTLSGAQAVTASVSPAVDWVGLAIGWAEA